MKKSKRKTSEEKAQAKKKNLSDKVSELLKRSELGGSKLAWAPHAGWHGQANPPQDLKKREQENHASLLRKVAPWLKARPCHIFINTVQKQQSGTVAPCHFKNRQKGLFPPSSSFFPIQALHFLSLKPRNPPLSLTITHSNPPTHSQIPPTFFQFLHFHSLSSQNFPPFHPKFTLILQPIFSL